MLLDISVPSIDGLATLRAIKTVGTDYEPWVGEAGSGRSSASPCTVKQMTMRHGTVALSLRLAQLFIGDLSDQTLTIPVGGGALMVSYRLQVGEETGVLQWLLPTDGLIALTAKPTHFRSREVVRSSPLSSHLRLTLRCGWKAQPITMQQLSSLQVGAILSLRGPLLIWCGERVVGVGHPCRKNGRLVVRMEQWRGVTTSSSLPTNHETEEGAERA